LSSLHLPIDNPFFKTEACRAAESQSQRIGYETLILVMMTMLPSRLNCLTRLYPETAAIICDNAGADATVAAVQKARDAGIPLSY
jgi:erythritol transport system substrate-binding protein